MAEVPKRVKGIPRSIQETIVMIRAACVAVPRYKEQEEAIKTRCINAELEFFDLYDMTEKQLSDDLGVGMGFCWVLLQSAKETAIGLTEGDKGFFCRVCPLQFPYIERLRRHEVMSKHQLFISAENVKLEVLPGEVMIDLELEKDHLVKVKEECHPSEGKSGRGAASKSSFREQLPREPSREQPPRELPREQLPREPLPREPLPRAASKRGPDGAGDGGGQRKTARIGSEVTKEPRTGEASPYSVLLYGYSLSFVIVFFVVGVMRVVCYRRDWSAACDTPTRGRRAR